MYAVHMLLSYTTALLLGLALLATALTPAWLAWTAIVFGAAGILGFATMGGGPFSPPFLAHLIPFLTGVTLLVRPPDGG